MKILIGTYEIAGWIELFKSGFKQLGHEVTTAVSQKSAFFDYEYDHILHQIDSKYRYSKSINERQFLQRVIRKIQNKFADAAYRKFIFKLIDEHDLIIRLWHPFLTNSEEYAYIKKKNKKLIQLFVGSDVRYFNAFKQQYDVHQWQFPDDFANPYISYQLSNIRNAEKYADLIYSAPDQAGLQLKPYYHLQIPLDIKKLTFKNHQRIIPKVLHAPTVPYKKGTDIIDSTLEKLKNEGIQFEFVSVRDLSHSKVLELLSDADVLVDELVFHGPGALSFEAMASGCVAATKYLDDSPSCFRPPIWSINPENIYVRLKQLLTDFELRQQLIQQGRDYVVNHNFVEAVSKGMLDNLENPANYDYYPDFFRKKYMPANEMETAVINQWTNFVKSEPWYKKCVPEGKRDGLYF